MNILLVGGTCSLMNNIILKLRKEGHRVFLLTGDKYKHSKYEKVFERYDFPYDSENLNEIIESVNPDVTILLGAFDTNYLWNGEERETVHFISHMVNILVAYSVVNRGKLIYLSSDEVFSGDYPDDITEGEKFSGSSGYHAEDVGLPDLYICKSVAEPYPFGTDGAEQADGESQSGDERKYGSEGKGIWCLCSCRGTHTSASSGWRYSATVRLCRRIQKRKTAVGCLRACT